MAKSYIKRTGFNTDTILMNTSIHRIHRYDLKRLLNTAKEMYQVLFDEKGNP